MLWTTCAAGCGLTRRDAAGLPPRGRASSQGISGSFSTPSLTVRIQPMACSVTLRSSLCLAAPSVLVEELPSATSPAAPIISRDGSRRRDTVVCSSGECRIDWSGWSCRLLDALTLSVVTSGEHKPTRCGRNGSGTGVAGAASAPAAALLAERSVLIASTHVRSVSRVPSDAF